MSDEPRKRERNMDLPPIPTPPELPEEEEDDKHPKPNVQIKMRQEALVENLLTPEELQFSRRSAIFKLADNTCRAILTEVEKLAIYEPETQVINWHFAGCPMEVVHISVASLQASGWDLKYDGERDIQLVMPPIVYEQPLKIVGRMSPEQPL